MRKVNVVSTKALPIELKQKALEQNVALHDEPMLSYEYIQNDDLKKLIEQPTDAFVFTSVNGVEAFRNLIGNKTLVTTSAYGLQEATLKAMTSFNLKVLGVANDASELVGAIVTNPVIKKVTFICGDKRRDELVDKLRANKIQVTEVVVYKTIVQPTEIEYAYDAVMFYSPSGVESFLRLNKLAVDAVAVCIGKTTASAVDQTNHKNILTATKHTAESMLQTLVQHLHTHQPV